MAESSHMRFFRQVESGQARLLHGRDRFTFKCSRCGACCHSNQILLKPYDIFRLTRALGIPSAEFLDRHCMRYIGQDSNLPLVMLKFLGDDGKGPCPFLQGCGCSVHADRPSVCRLYPLGAMGERGQAVKFYLQPAQCPGYGRGASQTLRSWLKASGQRGYLRENERFFELISKAVKSGVLKSRNPVVIAVLGELLYNFDEVVPRLAAARGLTAPTDWPGMFAMVEAEVSMLIAGGADARAGEDPGSGGGPGPA